MNSCRDIRVWSFGCSCLFLDLSFINILEFLISVISWARLKKLINWCEECYSLTLESVFKLTAYSVPPSCPSSDVEVGRVEFSGFVHLNHVPCLANLRIWGVSECAAFPRKAAASTVKSCSCCSLRLGGPGSVGCSQNCRCTKLLCSS